MFPFKQVIFTERLIAFNESFVPLGRNQKNLKSHAVLWHEAISGRNMEDITSIFYAFLLHNRDAQHVTFWLDNCAVQNKNWTFLSFLIYAINCKEIATHTITLKYFEPGHTFMLAFNSNVLRPF